MKIKAILLDMDGVCCNFVKGVCEVMGVNYTETLRDWPIGQYDITKVLGCNFADMWAKIDAKGKSFWRDLDEYEWFKPLYENLADIAPVFFLTSPSWSPDCVEGKLHWLQDRMGKDFRDYVFTNRKFLLSHRHHLLIDDSDEQCASFAGGEGRSIVFPQHWNSRVLPAGSTYVEHILHTINSLESDT